MRTYPSPMPRPLSILLATLALVTPGTARELTLLGLADMRGPSTFRTVRKEADGSFSDLTPRGLRASVHQVDGNTVETRSVFKPTIFFQNQGRFDRYEVIDVGLQLGGGMATVTQVTTGWSGQTSAQEIFELPSVAVSSSALTTMFQEILERGGDGTNSFGFLLKSARPANATTDAAEQGALSARFVVRVRDAAGWNVTGQVRFQNQPPGFPQKRVLEFRSSRRGRAAMTVNGVTVVTDFPVAAGFLYKLDIPTGTLVTGGNTAIVTVTDASDGTSQVLTVQFNS